MYLQKAHEQLAERFCRDRKDPDTGKQTPFPVDHVQFDPETGHLWASNGYAAMFVPFGGQGQGSHGQDDQDTQPTFEGPVCIPKAMVKSGKPFYDKDGVPFLGKTKVPQPQRVIPDVRCKMPDGEPAAYLSLRPEVLLSIAQFALDNESEGVTFLVPETDTKISDQPVNYFFEIKDDEGNPLLGKGMVMPLVTKEHDKHVARVAECLAFNPNYQGDPEPLDDFNGKGDHEKKTSKKKTKKKRARQVDKTDGASTSQKKSGGSKGAASKKAAAKKSSKKASKAASKKKTGTSPKLKPSGSFSFDERINRAKGFIVADSGKLRVAQRVLNKAKRDIGSDADRKKQVEQVQKKIDKMKGNL